MRDGSVPMVNNAFMLGKRFLKCGCGSETFDFFQCGKAMYEVGRPQELAPQLAGVRYQCTECGRFAAWNKDLNTWYFLDPPKPAEPEGPKLELT